MADFNEAQEARSVLHFFDKGDIRSYVDWPKVERWLERNRPGVILAMIQAEASVAAFRGVLEDWKDEAEEREDAGAG